MKLDFNLQLQQEQKLVMTQELQLAVKILQLNSCELNQYVQEQMEENPLIEFSEIESSLEKSDTDINTRDRMDEFIDYLGYDDGGYSREYECDEDDEYISPLNFVIRETDLWEYLKEQMNLMPLSLNQRKIGEYIIDNIDENGYLTVDLNNIKEKFDITMDTAEKMLQIAQSLEPLGVAARDIKECLIIQLRGKGINDNILEDIINNMLEYVADGNVYDIAKKCKISEAKAEEYINIIKSLDPKPGIRLSGDITKYIIPDVIIEKFDGEYVINVNQESVPTIKINNKYKKLLKLKDTPEYNYVKERLESALWLLRSIDQRISTIKRVMEAILNYQIDFFEFDYDLKPLTLKQIAEMTELHESTVSRAIKEKYVQTPKGLFEIKNFFVRGIQGAQGEEIATFKIKEEIKEIIDNENKKKPHSDQDISEILKTRSINISRRTVAKYREEIGIPSSSKRKRKE